MYPIELHGKLMKTKNNVKFLLNNMANWQEIEKNAKFPLNTVDLV